MRGTECFSITGNRVACTPSQQPFEFAGEQAIHQNENDMDDVLIADMELARALDAQERSSQAASAAQTAEQRACASQPAEETQWPTLAPLASARIPNQTHRPQGAASLHDIHSIRSSISYVGARSKPRTFLPEVVAAPQPRTSSSENALTAVLSQMPSVDAALVSDILEQVRCGKLLMIDVCAIRSQGMGCIMQAAGKIS
jgi:hypothetical protein